MASRLLKMVLLALAVAAAVTSAGATPAPASARPRYYDAVVVEAEGRAEGAGSAGGPLPQQLDDATCSLPPEQGPCRGYFTNFHYDATSARCRRFTYSGCGGNGNRFRSLKACEAGCGYLGLPDDNDKDKEVAVRDSAAVMALKADSDDTDSVEAGDAAVEVTDADCSWGRSPSCPAGCFLVNDALTDCPRCECSEETRRRLCAQPAVRGHCRALLTRWRYDPATGDCTQFRFGGCDGNANNFASRQQCLDACTPPNNTPAVHAKN